MFTTYPIPKILAPYVVSLYSVHWKSTRYPDSKIKEMLLPGGSPFMVFQVKGRLTGTIDHSVITPSKYYTIGQQTHRYVLTSEDPEVLVLGVAFSPTGFYALFHPQIKMGDLVNRPFHSEQLFGSKWDDHIKTFEKVTTLSSKIDCLCRLMAERTPNAKKIPAFVALAIDQMQSKNGCVLLNEVWKKLKVSERYFQKRFKEVTGIAPSVYNKIIRFNTLISEMDPKGRAEYNDLGTLFNYYDASHFAKDFKRFCGEAPSTFDMERFHFLRQAWVENPFFKNKK